MATIVHETLVTTNIHVPGYLQGVDPGPVGAGKMWVDTSGGSGAWIAKIRNVANGAWEILGYAGVSGYSGYSGIVGTSGYSGNPGSFGYSGYSGESGHSGYSGISGHSGYSGIVGTQGTSGYSGLNGAFTASGYSGEPGSSGYSGLSGFSGLGGVSSFSITFTNASLVAGILIVTHNLNSRILIVAMSDNNYKTIMPDEITSTDLNNINVDLTSYGVITGVWQIKVIT